MGFLSRWAEKRENSNRRQSLRLKREGYVLDLYARENTLLERLQSDTRGLGTSLRFGLSLTGANDDPDTEKELTDANVLIERILDSRVLCRDNPFARSAITNMQHYVVGPDGMRFHLNDPSKKSAAIKVAEVWNRWVEATGFVDHQHECVRRVMRDGAVYRRWFDNAEFRMIEPTVIKGLPGAEDEIERKWGIKTASDDVQTREVYDIDEGQGTFSQIPAAEVDYLNWKDADANVMRPSPLLFDFLEYLEGAASVLRNMRELVRVQTAIAIIREHPEGRAGHQINTWADSLADKDQTDTDTDRDVRQVKWQPGTMLDVQHGGKIHFPAAQMAVDKMTGALQADLRAVAAALGLPEFIFTADAGRNNYASLMAAEGPAVKTFTTFQGWFGRFHLQAFRRVMFQAATGGIIIIDPISGEQERLTVPRKVLRMLVTVNGPSVKTRDQFSEARTNSINAKMGVVSPQRIAQLNGDDYGEQMRLIQEHNINFGTDLPWPPPDPGVLDDAIDKELGARRNKQSGDQTGSETRNAGGAE